MAKRANINTNLRLCFFSPLQVWAFFAAAGAAQFEAMSSLLWALTSEVDQINFISIALKCHPGERPRAV